MPTDEMSFSIELELLKNAAESVADQMALTIVRTARSSVAKDSMDFSTSLVNVKGDVVAQGLCQPRHMCRDTQRGAHQHQCKPQPPETLGAIPTHAVTSQIENAANAASLTVH